MTETYNVPRKCINYVNGTILNCKDRIVDLERKKKYIQLAYYSFNIPLIALNGFSLLLPPYIPTIVGGLQAVYTFMNLQKKLETYQKEIHDYTTLKLFLEREISFNMEQKIGRYLDNDNIKEIKTDDDFENYMMFLEKRIDSVFVKDN